MFLFTAIVKDGVQFVMATNYRGLSSRRQHQTVQLSAFVAGGRQAAWGEADAHSSTFFSSECPSLHDKTL